ncbi:MAG: ABC transporter ATP-binding protein [Bryobacteraceae bacterium]
MNPFFCTQELGLRYNGALVLSGVSLEFFPGCVTAVVGPNGAGKSTLLSILAGLRRNYAGRCLYRGREVRDWARRTFAREAAFIPQMVRIEFPFTVEQVVLMGRTPYCKGLFEGPQDWEAAERAMRLTDVLELRRRDYRSLSGGEKQRTVLASVLAQEPRALILDEPATFLDLQHQIAIHRLLRELARQGMLVLTATHDLNLAAAFADRIVALRQGRVYCDLPPQEALNPSRIQAVFGVQAEVLRTPQGKPWVHYGDG